MEVGFHTEAFNSAYWGFGKCLDDAYRSVLEGSDVVIMANAAKFHPLHFKAAVEAGKHGDYMVRRTLIALIGLFSLLFGKRSDLGSVLEIRSSIAAEDVRVAMERSVKPGPDGTYPVYFTPGVPKLLRLGRSLKPMLSQGSDLCFKLGINLNTDMKGGIIPAKGDYLWCGSPGAWYFSRCSSMRQNCRWLRKSNRLPLEVLLRTPRGRQFPGRE
jgi:hypothetical protein